MIEGFRAVVRPLVTLGFAVSYTYMIIAGLEVPGEFYGLVGLTIGFYFKERENK